MKILAKSLLKYKTQELWEILTGEFTLVFDDAEVKTNFKEALYTSYIWDLLREFPIKEMPSSFYLKGAMTDGNYRANTHLQLLGTVVWSIYWEYLPKHNQSEESEWQFRKYLRRRVAETYNLIYNDLSYRLEEYVTSLDILDLIEVYDHPKVQEAYKRLFPNQKAIDIVYRAIQGVLNDPRELPDNSLGKITRAGNANPGQINQCIGPRGFTTEIDGSFFKKPILTSYLEGLHKFHDSLIDSRLAAKSLIFSKKPLQQAEFFSRRLQLMNEVVKTLHFRDCGSKHYLQWTVRGPHKDANGNRVPSDLKNLKGTWFQKEDGTEDWIRGNEENLIGQTLKLRNPIYCEDKDPQGVCAKCFGMLSFASFKNGNLGQYCWTFVAEKSTQSVLSVKHYDGTNIMDSIYIREDLRGYFEVSSSGSAYLLSKELKGKNLRLIIHPSNAEGINDIAKVDNVKRLSLARVTDIDEVGLQISDSIDKGHLTSINVEQQGRHANLTYEFLEYIKHNGYEIDENHNYAFDLSKWNWETPLMVLPLKHYSMGNHSRDISEMIESRMDQVRSRDTDISVDAFLVDFFDLVNTKLSVNLAILSVVVYGIMIVSAADDNYALPKPGTESGLGVMKLVMNRRSLSALLAYQGQRDAIRDPVSYVGQNRVPHPFDDIIMPERIGKDV